jgi:hypothetical protein
MQHAKWSHHKESCPFQPMRLQHMSKSTIFVTIDATIFHETCKKAESMNRWIVWTITLVIFSKIHINVEIKTIFNIKIVNF